MANTLAIKFGRPAWSVLRRYILGNRPLWFFVAFGALTTYILWPFYPDDAGSRDEWVGNIAVEGFGFLMDIILFGLLWSVFDVYRERRTKIRGYQDELRDFKDWKAQEGVLRKAGIIKRLNELRAQLPYLAYVHLECANLVQADLECTNLSGANLKNAVLHSANLKTSNLNEADLSFADLSHANLEGAHLAKASIVGAHLVGTNLKGADLRYAKLEGVDLERANLENAYLSNTDLEGSHLKGTSFRGADMREAILRHAELWVANLKGARLRWANLEGADLRRANLEGAVLWNANLDGAKDLTWDQLEEAETNDETILPAYLEKDAPEWYKGKFAGEEGE